MPRPIKNPDDDYTKRLLKHIPSEVLAVYLATIGVVMSIEPPPAWLLWMVFGVCLVATPFWLRFQQEVTSVLQIVLSCIAFFIWAMTVVGPFNTIPGYKNFWGSVLLLLFSGLIAPMLARFIQPPA